MTKYLYHLLIVSESWLTENDGGDASAVLSDSWGDDGWEIDHVVPRTREAGFILIMRRPKSN
jgi:hypothetical protein